MDNIHFNNADVNFILKNKGVLRQLIALIFKKEKKNLSDLSIVFCSDDYLLNLNNKFLQHNYYTDIITFNLSETPNIIVGEIYISADRIKENASKITSES